MGNLGSCCFNQEQRELLSTLRFIQLNRNLFLGKKPETVLEILKNYDFHIESYIIGLPNSTTNHRYMIRTIKSKYIYLIVYEEIVYGVCTHNTLTKEIENVSKALHLL